MTLFLAPVASPLFPPGLGGVPAHKSMGGKQLSLTWLAIHSPTTASTLELRLFGLTQAPEAWDTS